MRNRLAISAPSFFALAMLCSGNASQAQTPGNLYLSVASSTVSNSAGTEVDVQGFVKSAIESNGTTEPKATGVTGVVIYDPNVLTLSTSSSAGGITGGPTGSTVNTKYYTTLLTQSAVSFTLNGNNYSGADLSVGQLSAQKTLGTSPTTNPFNYATYNFMVNSGVAAGTVTTIYFSSDPTYGWDEDTLSNATNIAAPDASPVPSGSALASQATWSPAQPGGTTFLGTCGSENCGLTGGYITLTVGSSSIPAPPSILLFAAGSMPMLGLLRRRRNRA